MPLISDIVLIKGSVVAMFQVNSLTNDISQAVSTILDDAHAIPDLTVSSVNINGRSFTNFTRSTSSSSSSSSSNDSQNNTALIAGVTVGLVAALCLVIVGVYFYRVRKGNNPAVYHQDDNNLNKQYTQDNDEIERPQIWFPTIYPPPQITPTSMPTFPRHTPEPLGLDLLDLQEYPERENMDKVLNEMVHGVID